ncbi:hypothetical protein SEVIR_2G422501v4 [Setaria viridis]|nr:uncharacterized protein LOC117842559 [Setaria viridis]
MPDCQRARSPRRQSARRHALCLSSSSVRSSAARACWPSRLRIWNVEGALRRRRRIRHRTAAALSCNLARGRAMAGEEEAPFFRIGDDVLQGEEDAGESLKFEATREMEEEEDSYSFIVMLDGEVWRSKAPRSPRRTEAEEEAGATRMEEHETPELEVMGPEDDEPHWMSVSKFRRYRNKRWSGHYGSFEDTTRIPPMRFTEKPLEKVNARRDTLKIFSVKLATTRGNLQLSFYVFGMVAIRDSQYYLPARKR